MKTKFSKRLQLLIWACTLAWMGLIAWITAYGLRVQIAKADVVVVPGNTVYQNGQLSARLQARLDKALLLYQQGCCKAILVSGAVGAEAQDEALAMQRYLLQRGLSTSAILVDQAGYTSWDTAKNTRQLLARSGYQDVIIVSQFFHLARLRLAMELNRVNTKGQAAADYFEARDVYALLRESVAYLDYSLRQAD